MIRRLLLVLVSVGHLCSVPVASAREANSAVTVVYWGSRDCRWCTYWESSASGLETEFRASTIFPSLTYHVIRNPWLNSPYGEGDFSDNQRWLWNLAANGSFRLPRVRPTWSVFVGRNHVRNYIGTKAWKEAALPAIQRLVVAGNDSSETLIQVLSELQPSASGQKIAVTDIDAVPYLDRAGKDAYREWLARATPRAFALSLDGAWGRGRRPDDAMKYCQRYAEEPCELYAVNSDVVWRNSGGN